MVWQAIVSFFETVGRIYSAAIPYIDAALTIATLAVGEIGRAHV